MPARVLNGAELFFESIGDGPATLMLHGNGLDHSYLRPWHDALARDRRLVFYDQRWNGRSQRIGPSDHETMHEDAIALLDHLGIQRTTVFGHSYGAWLSLGLAARHPERIERLILCGASPAFDYVPEVIATAQARNPAAAEVLISGLSSGVAADDDLRALWQRILPLYFHGAPRPEILSKVRYSAEGFARAMQALDGFSMVDRLPTLDIPILVLVGRDDYITPPSQARRLASLAPNATVVELEQSGHFPFVEETSAYLDAIQSWWRC